MNTFPPELMIVIFAGLGLIVGSFLNVVIHRLPMMILHEGDDPAPNLMLPASHCPACGNELRWYHNIPVISYLFLFGKCGWCNTTISFRYPAVEVMTAVFWVGVLFAVGDLSHAMAFPLKALLWAVLASLFIAMFFIDAETMLLPDSLTLGVLWLGLLGASWGLTDLSVAQSVHGAAAGYLFMRAFIFCGDYALKKPCMGQGDAKLVAALGALFGTGALPLVLLMASAFGILIYVILKWRRSIEDGYAPFGPALILGGLAYALGVSQL